MERGLILLIAALCYVVTAVHGSAHLSFSNNTKVNITRDGCGVSKLCVEFPEDCDPTDTTNCLFGSVTATGSAPPNGTDLSMQLRGESLGYIALGLTVDSSMGTTMLFVCAQNTSDNGTFVFATIELNNTDNKLSQSERTVTEIRGVVNGSVIQCEFNVPNVNATQTRSADTTFSILLGNGTYDGTTLGPFQSLKVSGPQDIADPTSNASDTTNNTTSSSAPSGVFLPNAGLLLLTVVTLPAMLRG